jgi:hypothetical protein
MVCAVSEIRGWTFADVIVFSSSVLSLKSTLKNNIRTLYRSIILLNGNCLL